MTGKPDCKCCRFTVRGKVQGVFFRASTRRTANDLGITGHAVNMRDGGVEVLACGGARSLQALREWLKQGPAMARVDELREEVHDGAAPPSFTTG